MSDPKKHHILPRFYLEHFSKNGRLQIYDRQKREFREGTPPGTAYQKHFYSVERANGTKDPAIEKWLANVEGKAQEAIKMLEKRGLLSQENEAFLALFAGLMWTRTMEFDRSVKSITEPLLKNLLREVATLESAKAFLSAKEGIQDAAVLETEATKLCSVISNGGFEIKMNRNMPLPENLQTSCCAWTGYSCTLRQDARLSPVMTHSSSYPHLDFKIKRTGWVWQHQEPLSYWR